MEHEHLYTTVTAVYNGVCDVKVERCANCSAVRISRTIAVLEDGGWVAVTKIDELPAVAKNERRQA